MCLVTGKPNTSYLSHAKFSVNDRGCRQNRTSDTDEDLFKEVYSTIAKEVREGWLHQALFPVKLAELKYSEVRFYVQHSNAVNTLNSRI